MYKIEMLYQIPSVSRGLPSTRYSSQQKTCYIVRLRPAVDRLIILKLTDMELVQLYSALLEHGTT